MTFKPSICDNSVRSFKFILDDEIFEAKDIFFKLDVSPDVSAVLDGKSRSDAALPEFLSGVSLSSNKMSESKI